MPQACTVERGLTTFFVATETEVLGQICLADKIKPDAALIMKGLKDRGIKSIMLLTGDKKSVAQSVAHALGIKDVYAEVMPDKKLAMLADLQKQHQRVTMIGDGINDAPALKQADVGIAIGSMGMEPAIQAANIVLMSDDLHQILFLYDLAKAAMRTVKQNLLVGFALTHTVGIILALLSYITPVQAALFHAIPDGLIMLNAARLMNFGKKNT